MKRIIFLSIILLLLCIAPMSISQANTNQDLHMSYKIKGNGTAILTAYYWNWNEDNDVYIPRTIDGYTVTEIGDYCFSPYSQPGSSERYFEGYMSWHKLKDSCYGVDRIAHKYSKPVAIILPDTIKVIGEKAFFCTDIASCNIPASVEYIGSGAFAGCTNITQFSVQNGSDTFAVIDGVLYNKKTKELVAFPVSNRNGENVESISIPEGIKSIGDNAFFNMDYTLNNTECLKKENGRPIEFPSTLTHIGKYAFAYAVIGNNKNEFNLNNVSTIDDNCFYYARILTNSEDERIILPSTVSDIGEHAFYGVSQTIDLSYSSISSIPTEAFSYDRVNHGNIPVEKKVVYLPSTIKEICNKAFSFTAVLNEATFSDCKQLKTIGDEAFLGAITENESKVVLPEGIESIGNKAFFSDDISLLVIPSSVKSIGSDICDRTHTKLQVESGSYAEFYALENGIPFIYSSGEDTSWLND